LKNLLKLLTVIAVTLLFSACNNTTDAKIAKDTDIKPMNQHKTDTKTKVVKTKKVSQEANDIFYSTFKDTAKVGPNGKNMVLVFGTNTDPYTMKLKEDIFKTKDLRDNLKNNYTSYYFKAHENLRHKLFHENEFMDVDTKTMINIYAITVTPTIIFSDKKAKAILVVPGYMPSKQFLATMKFIDNKKLWENKNRKNGEVYKALKEFYIKEGIITK
jgi:thioredoxin-related protein